MVTALGGDRTTAVDEPDVVVVVVDVVFFAAVFLAMAAATKLAN